MTKRYNDMQDFAESISNFNSLIGNFRQISDLSLRKETAEATSSIQTFGNLLCRYENAVVVWRGNQEAMAEDFNILEVMNFVFDEVRHSMLLAWLLDSDITICQSRGKHLSKCCWKTMVKNLLNV
jgi:hypothetical protein